MSGSEDADDAGAQRPQMTARVSNGQHTEEEILAVRIGAPPPDDGVVVIADYDPEWPRLFEREAARIRAALGERYNCWSMLARPPCRGWPPSRASTSSSRFPTPLTSHLTFRRWRRPAMFCASASRTGTSIASSRGQTPT